MAKITLAFMISLSFLLPYVASASSGRSHGHAQSESSGREHDRAEGTNINEDMDEEEEHMGIGGSHPHRGTPIDEVLVGPPRRGDPYYDYIEENSIRAEKRLRDRGH